MNVFKYTFDDEICDDLYLYRLRSRHLDDHHNEVRKAIEESRRERGLV